MDSIATRTVGAASTGIPAVASPPGVAAGGKPLVMAGAWSAVVGALLAALANALHPHPTDFHLEALLAAIAQSRTWGALHLTLIVALVLILVALVAVTFSTEGEPGATLARVACLVSLLGGALILVSTAMDGFAMNQLARAWFDAPVAEQAAALRTAAALEAAGYAIYSVSIVLFLGACIFLYGLATALGSAYPKALGWLAMLSGSGAFVVGIVQAMSGPSYRGAELAFVLCSFLSTLWVLLMGVAMLRRARAS